jgi:hypothetical protein
MFNTLDAESWSPTRTLTMPRISTRISRAASLPSNLSWSIVRGRRPFSSTDTRLMHSGQPEETKLCQKRRQLHDISAYIMMSRSILPAKESEWIRSQATATSVNETIHRSKRPASFLVPAGGIWRSDQMKHARRTSFKRDHEKNSAQFRVPVSDWRNRTDAIPHMSHQH